MKRLTLIVSLGLLLTACTEGDQQELRSWMDENSRDLRGRVQPLPEVKPYEPVPYLMEASIDPFKAGKIEPASKSRKSGPGGAFQPDFEARELRNNVLEKYPLESLKMIGRMVINNRPIAVIQYEDKVKQVKVGDYIGLDFGVVTEIGETDLKLRELIQDSAGDWSERQSSLYLQSKEGGSK